MLALLYAMVLGADSVDDCELLHAGSTHRLLGGWLPTPSEAAGRFRTAR